MSTGANVAGVPRGLAFFRGRAATSSPPATGRPRANTSRSRANTAAAAVNNAAAIATTQAVRAVRAALPALPTAEGTARAAAGIASTVAGREHGVRFGEAVGSVLGGIYTAATNAREAAQWHAAASAYVDQPPLNVAASFRAKQRSSPATLTRDLASACQEIQGRVRAPQVALDAQAVRAAAATGAAEGAVARGAVRGAAEAAARAPQLRNARGRFAAQTPGRTWGQAARNLLGTVTRFGRRVRTPADLRANGPYVRLRRKTRKNKRVA
jgi:hypothetical protein